MLKFSLLFLALSTVTCGSVGNNYIIDRPDNDAPRDANTPFKVYWNVPTKQCRSKGIPFDKLLEKFKISYNKNDRFEGETITIIYNVGLVPSVLRRNGEKFSVVNGGVPQEGNLEQHLTAFRESVVRLIPDPDFNGIGVLDLEQWRPIFRQHWSAQASIVDLSLSIEMRKYWWWPTKWQKLEAAKRFEDAARIFMEKTLSTAKQMRPKATWGYYGFPYCFNMEGNNMGSEHCSKDVNVENDRLYWLWAESTALYPSLYCQSFMKTSEIEKLVSGRLSEANRVKGIGDLVLPYFALTYRDGPFFKESDVMATFNILQKKGASGLVIWGASNDVNTSDKCNQLYKYINDIFGPIALKYIEKFNKIRDNKTQKSQVNKYSNKSDNNRLAPSDNANLLTNNSTQKNIETKTVLLTKNVTNSVKKDSYPNLLNTSGQEQQLNKYYYEIGETTSGLKSSNDTDFWNIIPFGENVTKEIDSTLNTSNYYKNGDTVVTVSSPTYALQSKYNTLDYNLQPVMQQEKNILNIMNTTEATESIFTTLTVNCTSPIDLLLNITGTEIVNKNIKSTSISGIKLLSESNNLQDILQSVNQEKQFTQNTSHRNTSTKYRAESYDSDYLIILTNFTTPNNTVQYNDTTKYNKVVTSANGLEFPLSSSPNGLNDIYQYAKQYTTNSTHLRSEEVRSKENDVDDYLITFEVDFTSPKKISLTSSENGISLENEESASDLGIILLPQNYTTSSGISHDERCNESTSSFDTNTKYSEESDTYIISPPTNVLNENSQNFEHKNFSKKIYNIDTIDSKKRNNFNNLDFTSPKTSIMNNNDKEIDTNNLISASSTEFTISLPTSGSYDISQNTIEDFDQNSTENEKNTEDYLLMLVEDFTTSNHVTNDNSPNINKQEEIFTKTSNYTKTNIIDSRQNNDSDNLIVLAVDYTSPKSISMYDKNTESIKFTLPIINKSLKDISQAKKEDELISTNAIYLTEETGSGENNHKDHFITSTINFTTPPNTLLNSNYSNINFETLNTTSDLKFTIIPRYILNDKLEDAKQGENITENIGYLQSTPIDRSESSIFDNLITLTGSQNLLSNDNDTTEVEIGKSASSLGFTSPNYRANDIPQYIKQHKQLTTNSSSSEINALSTGKMDENVLEFTADLSNPIKTTIHSIGTKINLEDVKSSSTLNFLVPVQSTTQDYTDPSTDNIRSRKSHMEYDFLIDLRYNSQQLNDTEIDLSLQPEQQQKKYYYEADYNKAEFKSSNDSDVWSIIVPYEEVITGNIDNIVNTNGNNTKITPKNVTSSESALMHKNNISEDNLLNVKQGEIFTENTSHLNTKVIKSDINDTYS